MATHRRTATRVKSGRVQKKNNWEPQPRDFRALHQDEIQLERRDPGEGCKHLLTVADLRRFIRLLPEWDVLAPGLDAIVLDTGGDHLMGWNLDGVVAVCAWERDLWWNDADPWFVGEHATILDLLDVDVRQVGPRTELRWTEQQARAFQLLHILPHELGHHHDQFTTRATPGTPASRWTSRPRAHASTGGSSARSPSASSCSCS
jgi:hypothetical protein